MTRKEIIKSFRERGSGKVNLTDFCLEAFSYLFNTNKYQHRMRIIFTFVLLAICHILAFEQKIQPDVIQQISITSLSDQATLELAPLSTDTSFKLQGKVIPCWGAFDTYVGLGNVPTPTDNAFSKNWSSIGQTETEVAFEFKNVVSNTTVYLQLNALDKTYIVGKPFASFEVYLGSNVFGAQWPTPGDNGQISITLDDGGKSAFITLTATDNDTDTYEVYTYAGELPEGAFTFSSCGVRAYATKQNNILVESSGNQKKISFSGLDPSVPTYATVIVTRANYSSNYGSAIFNSSNILKSSISLLLLSVLLVFLFI
ncbi:hypothetical protein DFA_07585 [Cavenderia fasciculata]|uniref:Uncharacterized protein n=1 Tax=Cavenderia fasciculata TaxID=261658 RepID=F4Q621_CACFS|nr:uncharacterized protein DFA_07585 [Cavenderia fasciculata]EGG16607.1 hypothetical protein DFA_07585 [Cavenderia fasciculata]|eukprot:XP_004355081.1 hypothetical protein DFA_07585 [Cavenderia fasciculata]